MRNVGLKQFGKGSEKSADVSIRRLVIETESETEPFIYLCFGIILYL
jgi:hypothetical protein